MRLKEDNSSWKSSGIRRKDFRNDRGTSETPKHRNSKDTKRWCLGKVEREHKVEWIKKPGSHPSISFWIHQCEICGKILDRWFKCPWMNRQKPEGIQEN